MLRRAGRKEREGDSRKHGFKLAEAAANGRGRQPGLGGSGLGVEAAWPHSGPVSRGIRPLKDSCLQHCLLCL